MLHILRAEFRRSVYHTSLLVFVGATLLACILALTFQISGILEVAETRELITEFERVFSFPNSLVTSLEISQFLFIFLVPTAVGYYVGQDYQLNTWKMILPRTPQRGLLLLSKSVNVGLLLAGLFLIVFGCYIICGLIGALWLDASIISDSVFQISFENQQKLLNSLSFILWYVSVSVLITILSRSVVIAASCSLVFYLFCSLIQSYSPEFISVWFAPTHFGNLIPVPPDMVLEAGSSRPNISPIISWMVVTFHIGANILISYIALLRQEFSGN